MDKCLGVQAPCGEGLFSWTTRRVPVAMFVSSWAPRPGKKYQSLAVPCDVWRAYAKTADQIRIRITADWDNFKKFSGPHQSQSTRRKTGPKRHPVQIHLLMRRQRRSPMWSHHPMRRMIGKVTKATSCARGGIVRTCGDRAAPARR